MSYESEIVYDNTKTLDPRIKDRLKYDDKGLVCAVIQQYDTHEVLMVGYMDDEALRRTLTTGRVTFWIATATPFSWKLIRWVLHATPASAAASTRVGRCRWSWASANLGRRQSEHAGLQ